MYHRECCALLPIVYVYMPCSFCLIVFGIVSFTGGLEPYESALIAAVLYVVQARYRTADVPLSKIPEIVATSRLEQVERLTK